MKTSFSVKLILHLIISIIPLTISSEPIILRLDLTHVDSGRGFTRFELLQRMTSRTNARTAAANHPISVPVHPGSGDEPYDREYLAKLSIGTPPQPVTLTLDTGSDLVWTQCSPCIQCFDQGLPLYDPSISSTFESLPCTSDLCSSLPTAACHKQCFYLYQYGDGSATVGTVSTETFRFGNKDNKVEIPNIGFGCGFINGGVFVSNESGILGIGRGPVSLISQLSAGGFSYCFTSLFASNTSPLFINTNSTNFYNNNNSVRGSTPMLQNPSSKGFYYLNLTGITVGDTRLNIPHSAFALRDDGTGGVMIDSGTAITVLNDDAYTLVKKAFIHQIKLPVAKESIMYLDLCFVLPNKSSNYSTKVQVPRFVFHFEDLDLELPRENYVYEDRSAGELCLVMISSGDTSTIIGNFQQQNIHVLYDLKNERMAFAPAQCDKL